MAQIINNQISNISSSEMVQHAENMSQHATENLKELKANVTQINRRNPQPLLQKYQTELDDAINRSSVKEIVMGMIAEMSGGKSRLINGMLGYPLLPVATLTTSSVPVEIRYGAQPTLEVYVYDQEESNQSSVSLKKTRVFSFKKCQDMTPAFKLALLKYVQTIMRDALNCENVDMYSSFMKMNIDFLAPSQLSAEVQALMNDPFFLMQMLLVLLTAYIGQDQQKLREARPELIKERLELLGRLMGAKHAQKPFGVHVTLNCDVLKNGLVLVDLPGLGADNTLHTEVTRHYMKYVDTFILPFEAILRVSNVSTELKKLLQNEAMKHTNKDARFIVAMNKCDIQMLKDPDNYSSVLRQTVTTIRPLLSEINISQIYPISAAFADYRLLKSGISPRKTDLGKQMAGPRSRRPVTDQEIAEALKEDYEFPFRYTDMVTGKEIVSSTAYFMEEVIGNHTPKIRFLNALRDFYTISEKYNSVLNQFETQKKFLQMLQKCGDVLVRDLLIKMKQSMRAVEMKLDDELQEVTNQVAENILQTGKVVQRAKTAYVDGLDRANRDMNDFLEKKIGQMNADFWGHYMVEGNNQHVAHNKAVLNEIISYFKTFDFMPYQQNGYALLKNNFQELRKIMNQLKKKVNQLLLQFERDAAVALDAAYEAFERELNKRQKETSCTLADDNMLTVYKKCFKDARKALLVQIQGITQDIWQKISKNDPMEQQLAQTVDDVDVFFAEYAAHYHERCLSYINLVSSGRTFFNSNQHVDVDRIRSEINLPFYTSRQHQDKVGQLEHILVDQANPDCHVQRISATSDNYNTLIQQTLSQKLTAIAPQLEQSILPYFGRSGSEIQGNIAEIETWCTQLRGLLKKLMDNSEVQNGFSAASMLPETKTVADECRDHIRKIIEGSAHDK